MPDPAKEIIKAAKNGRVEALKALLALDAGLINARDKDGSMPIHLRSGKVMKRWSGH